jgi:hypothetical protein
MTGGSEVTWQLPITEWVLDKVITVPAENLEEPAAIGYFIVAGPVIGVAALGGYAADELNHLIVHPTAMMVDAIVGAFADDDVPLFPLETSPSAEDVPAPTYDVVPANDELPLQQEQYAPAVDELPADYSPPVNANEDSTNAAGQSAKSELEDFFEASVPIKRRTE